MAGVKTAWHFALYLGCILLLLPFVYFSKWRAGKRIDLTLFKI